MKNWVIFGAGGEVGKELLKLTEESGQKVFAVVRKPELQPLLESDSTKVFVGDASNEEFVADVLRQAGKDAVIISTMGGPTANYLGNRLIVDTAEKLGLSRLLLLTSLGCSETWQYLSMRGREAFGHDVREKSLAETWLRTSSLDHCILRPGGLVTRNATGNAELSQNKEVHGFVTRADVAKAIYTLSEKEPFGNQAYAIVDVQLSEEVMKTYRK